MVQVDLGFLEDVSNQNVASGFVPPCISVYVFKDAMTRLLEPQSESVERCYFPCFCRKQLIPLPGNLEAILIIHDVLMLQPMPVC